MSESSGPVAPIERDGRDSKPGYSSKYILQTHGEQGYIVTLGTYDHVVTPEEAVRQFGKRVYTLKRVSPRFSVEWRHVPVEKPESASSDRVLITQELEQLKKRTKLNSYAIVGLGIVTGAGFTLSHLRFSRSEVRIAQLEAVAKTMSVQNLRCPGCANGLDFMLQRFCTSCGISLNWPIDQIPTQPSSLGSCQCGYPRVADQKFCPNCGEAHFAQLRFVTAGVD